MDLHHTFLSQSQALIEYFKGCFLLLASYYLRQSFGLAFSKIGQVFERLKTVLNLLGGSLFAERHVVNLDRLFHRWLERIFINFGNNLIVVNVPS
jgi:hypothetical protein